MPSNTTSYISDDNVSRHLDVGANHTISVCSLNSAGCSERVNASVSMLVGCVNNGNWDEDHRLPLSRTTIKYNILIFNTHLFNS